ncbi:ATP-dependent helicase [Corynebacterium camporealensis]
MFSPNQIARALGKKFLPTDEQAQVMEEGLKPKLVVAGAGAGKTETMASRVVYLVANGMVRPEQVLGLTFTRKAAQQLEQRIRKQLQTLRSSGLIVPGSPAAEALETIAPKVSTYDSYAGELLREYGLLVPVEPSARIITEAERYAIAREVVINYGGKLVASQAVPTVTKTLLRLTESIDNSLLDTSDIEEQADAFLREVQSLEKSKRSKTEFSQNNLKYMETQTLRKQYLPLVDALKAEQAEQRVITFGEQMSVAAQLAAKHPVVGKEQRARYRVVMLDEYQDTSHAQRVLLRSLFGNAPHEGLSVTAVGDPMQAIYGWRGATAENLTAFVEDFPQADGVPADKDQLLTSWRNPVKALQLANTVATGVFAGGTRPVGELSPRECAPEGEVQLAYFETPAEEHGFIAKHLRRLWDARDGEFKAAVLVRQNKQAIPIAEALEEAGVPYEIVGLGGLLWEPEIQDLVALATLLVRPQASTAALRVLSGPLCGLGIQDLQALAARQRNLAGVEDNRVRYEGGDPLEHLRAELAVQTAEKPDQVLGLGDALADLGERDRYTPEGLERMEEVAAKLRHLRTYSLAKPLADLFADIEALFNLRTEVLARGRAGGATHLDQFAEFVAGFHGDSLGALLDYFELARDEEGGLEAGEVPATTDRVQILTAHKAKGLEWDHVCVAHADSQSYAAKAETFVTKVDKAPGPGDEIPLDLDATTRTEFEKACKQFMEEAREHNAEESARLFYVAMTRTESTLTITGSGTNRQRGKLKKGPYEYFETLKNAFPDLVVHWEVPETPEAEDGRTLGEEKFPQLKTRAEVGEAAELVREGIVKLPALSRGETFDLWEQETSALIAEYEALQTPRVDVELPKELTASDFVALGRDAVQYARRQRRPVPFKPNKFAKRGTAFHSWVEDLFGGQALLDEDQLPGMGEDPTGDVEELKEAFLNSEWAQRTPVEVEKSFYFTLHGSVLNGRMDAVFQEPDGSYLVVDWKTGRPPQGAELKAAELQLAVYAEALRQEIKGAKVRAVFHYVSSGFTLEPKSLPAGKDLAAVLDSSVEWVED